MKSILKIGMSKNLSNFVEISRQNYLLCLTQKHIIMFNVMSNKYVQNVQAKLMVLAYTTKRMIGLKNVSKNGITNTNFCLLINIKSKGQHCTY